MSIVTEPLRVRQERYRFADVFCYRCWLDETEGPGESEASHLEHMRAMAKKLGLPEPTRTVLTPRAP